jgi:hypothetical protein
MSLSASRNIWNVFFRFLLEDCFLIVEADCAAVLGAARASIRVSLATLMPIYLQEALYQTLSTLRAAHDPQGFLRL